MRKILPILTVLMLIPSICLATFPTGWTCYGYTDFDKPSSALTNFPIYVTTSNFPSDLSSHLRSDGGDLRCSLNSDGTSPLNREIVDTSSPLSEVWVRIPSMSSVTDTRVYWWANGSTAEPAADDANHGSEGVWGSDYKFVSHDGGLTDSTSNNENGTNHGTTLATGKIGSCREFDGTNDYITLSTMASTFNDINNALTISAWVKRDTLTGVTYIISKYNSTTTSTLRSFVFTSLDGGKSRAGFYKNGETHNLYYVDTDNAINTDFEFIVAVEDLSSTSIKFYFNGAIETVSSHTIGSPPTTLTSNDMLVNIGSLQADKNFMKGKIDEIRLNTAIKSADWISHEYSNQNDPANFGTGHNLTTSTFTPIVISY